MSREDDCALLLSLLDDIPHVTPVDGTRVRVRVRVRVMIPGQRQVY